MVLLLSNPPDDVAPRSSLHSVRLRNQRVALSRSLGALSVKHRAEPIFYARHSPVFPLTSAAFIRFLVVGWGRDGVLSFRCRRHRSQLYIYVLGRGRSCSHRSSSVTRTGSNSIFRRPRTRADGHCVVVVVLDFDVERIGID